MQNNQDNQANSLPHLCEDLEAGDLARLLDPEITIDEYKSKMGSDEEVIVISFLIQNKDAANDLVSFIEKSYEWILDADTSPGELDSGKYIVFVETNREPQAIENIGLMLEDMENLVQISPQDYKITYHKPRRTGGIDTLKTLIPTTPEEYRNLHRRLRDDIDNLKMAAGVPIKTKAPKNEYTESLRIAAGIR